MSRRVRKHANPFTVVTRVAPLDRRAQFGREAKLEVDVGCGAGDFLLRRARARPDLDFVGFEIRRPLVEAANARARAEGLRNMVVFYANAHENVDLAPPGEVTRFCIQFPDPCFKRRHWKRRIVQPFFVRRMAEQLPIGGEIFAQSDVRPLAEEMLEMLTAERALEPRLPTDLSGANPFEERTEWERQHEREGEPVYRMLFEKVREPEGPIPEVEFRDTNPLRVGVEARDPRGANVRARPVEAE